VAVLDRTMIQLEFRWRARPAFAYLRRTRRRYCFTVSSLIAIFLATDFSGIPVAYSCRARRSCSLRAGRSGASPVAKL